MMRVAVVDLGTNSTRLLVADVEDGYAHEIERRQTITKLGQQVDAGRMLVPEASERVLACLAGYCRTIERFGVEHALAYATSAVRDAINGDAFLERIESEFGLPTRLLSGEEEALLTFRGVGQGRTLPESTLIVDLGGGSTEIIVGDASGIAFHRSVPIGCVRLTERFLREDPVGADELDSLVLYVRDLLEHEMPPNQVPLHGIGTAGTVTTLGTLHLGLPEEDPAVLHGHRLPVDWIAAEAARLSAMTTAERAQVRGIAPDRAPVIAAGATAIAEIVAFFGLHELEISEFDILHGVALELAHLQT
jgi:exopolyphosphatase/guanosine-5'-triphosphate,3'-diphosphate pyrophosphatase